MPEEYDYEAPSAEEKLQLTIPQDAVDRELRRNRLARAAEQREEEVKRTTALSLAVQWTAPDADIPFSSLLGISDLMVRYIETGERPTAEEFNHAVREFE